DDHDPSLEVDPARGRWKCWPCNLGGDAAELVHRLNPGWTFPEVVAYLAGEPAPSMGSGRPRLDRSVRNTEKCSPKPPVALSGTTDELAVAKAPTVAPERSSGLPLPDAVALVEDAEKRLWEPEGAAALDYLRRDRGLTETTIRAARLGWVR